MQLFVMKWFMNGQKIDKKETVSKTQKRAKVEVKEKAQSQPKKKPNELEGQMDLFSMMGL